MGSELFSIDIFADEGMGGTWSPVRAVTPRAPAALNLPLLRTLSDLYTAQGSATVRVDAGSTRWTLVVDRGQLVDADSNRPSDLLGSILASEGQLDPEALEQLAEDAKKRGKFLGQHVLEEGLAEPWEVAQALDRQIFLRLEGALTTQGATTVTTTVKTSRGFARSLGALLVTVFRDRLRSSVVDAMVASLPERPELHFPPKETLADLSLLAEEETLWRRLAAEATPELSLAAGLLEDEANRRFLVALQALGFLR